MCVFVYYILCTCARSCATGRKCTPDTRRTGVGTQRDAGECASTPGINLVRTGRVLCRYVMYTWRCERGSKWRAYSQAGVGLQHSFTTTVVVNYWSRVIRSGNGIWRKEWRARDVVGESSTGIFRLCAGKMYMMLTTKCENWFGINTFCA